MVCGDRSASKVTGSSVRALRREPHPPTPRRRNLATGMTAGVQACTGVVQNLEGKRVGVVRSDAGACRAPHRQSNGHAHKLSSPFPLTVVF